MSVEFNGSKGDTLIQVQVYSEKGYTSTFLVAEKDDTTKLSTRIREAAESVIKARGLE